MMMKRMCLGVMFFITAGFAAGCYDSEFPLDPAPQIEIDTRLIGSWRCATPNPRDEALTLTVDSSTKHTYAVSTQESTNEPGRYAAYASSIKGTTLLNVWDPAAKQKRWGFFRYSMLPPNVLHVQVVGQKLLKGVATSAEAVRKTVERELNNPELYEDLMVCIRAPARRIEGEVAAGAPELGRFWLDRSR